MSLNEVFDREEIFPSWFANRIQDFLSGVRTDLRLSKASATAVEVIPNSIFGVAAIAIEGRWRFRTTTTQRSHPGGTAGTYIVWAVATDNDIDNTPDPFTDHTDYNFTLRITAGENPSGAGVEIFEKIGEIDWSGTEITRLAQLYGAIPGAMIGAGALTSAGDIDWERASGGNLTPTVKTAAITAGKLAPNAVTEAKLLDLAVSTAKIAAQAITNAKLGLSAVGAENINNLAVTAAKLAAEAVTNEKLGAGAVTGAKIQSGTIDAVRLAVDSVIAEKIQALAVTAAKLAAEAVETGKIQNLAVTAAKLAANAVETAKIANLAVTAEKIAAEAVEAAKIKNLAVTEGKLANLAVTEGKLADKAVTSRKFLPTQGEVLANADVSVSGSFEWVEIPGTLIEIEPPVASLIYVWARAWVNVTTLGQGVLVSAGSTTGHEGYSWRAKVAGEKQQIAIPLRVIAAPANVKTPVRLYANPFGGGGAATVKSNEKGTGYYYMVVAQ